MTDLQLQEVPAFKGVVAQVTKITQVQNNLGQAMMHNTQAFGDAFTMVDMHVHVIQKVLDDMMTGSLQRTAPNGDGKEPGINWNAYKKYYWQCMEFEGFIRVLNNLKVSEEAKTEEPEEAVVFGGEGG